MHGKLAAAFSMLMNINNFTPRGLYLISYFSRDPSLDVVQSVL